MKISGNEDEMVDDKSTERTNSSNDINLRRYTPAGHLAVEDNSANTNINLKGVTVKTRRFFNLHNATTNVNGDFTINGSYAQKATVVIKFKNDFATTRGINGLLKEWQYVFPVKRNIGLYDKTAMERINFVFRYNSVSNTNEAMQWVAATFMNNNWEMRTNCQTFNLPAPPANLNVWLSSAITTEASTPMLRYISNTSAVSYAVDMFLLGQPELVVLKHVLQSILPDITCRYGRDHGQPLPSWQLNNAFFHEQAHAVHYTQVGNNYWTQYISYIVDLGGYGNKTTDGAERIAVSEAWGFYIGNTFNSNKYNALGATPIAISERDQLENQIPDNNISFAVGTTPTFSFSRGWIPAGMLYDMTDNAENTAFTGVNDNVNAYNIQQIFNGLQSNVTTVQDFRSEVLSRNSSLQVTQLNQLVSDYHY